ncbi:MAG: hypothetical protein IJY15_04805, partial [Thermoguttaceae bacterium]|nr:hypothetical protein [Thermoguttaceae bacterium]
AVVVELGALRLERRVLHEVFAELKLTERTVSSFNVETVRGVSWQAKLRRDAASVGRRRRDDGF